MTDDLQSLLDRIHTEGIDKARTEAEAIVAAAKKEAEEIRARAKAEADEIRSGAQSEAKAFERRAEQSVRQAVRDVRLQVAQDLQNMVEGLLLRDVKASFKDAESLTSWVSKALSAYIAGGEKAVELELGGSAAAQAERLRAEFAGLASEAGGVKITASPSFPEGFTVRLAGGRVEQSFTAESVTDALARILRPQIAAFLK